MPQQVTFLALLSGLLLAAGCTPNDPTAGDQFIRKSRGSDYTAADNNHPEKERDIQSKTDSPVMGKPGRGPRQIDYNNPTSDDIRVLVERARDYYRHNGDYKSLDDFMDPSSQFVSGRSYIFAYDYSGRCLAEWGTPGLVGNVPAPGTPEADFLRDAAEKAKNGGGWITTMARVPGSSESRMKECYVLNIGDKLFIGSGLYR